MKNLLKIIGVSLGIATLMLGVIQLCFRLQRLFCGLAGEEEDETDCWPV